MARMDRIRNRSNAVEKAPVEEKKIRGHIDHPWEVVQVTTEANIPGIGTTEIPIFVAMVKADGSEIARCARRSDAVIAARRHFRPARAPRRARSDGGATLALLRIESTLARLTDTRIDTAAARAEINALLAALEAQGVDVAAARDAEQARILAVKNARLAKKEG